MLATCVSLRVEPVSRIWSEKKARMLAQLVVLSARQLSIYASTQLPVTVHSSNKLANYAQRFVTGVRNSAKRMTWIIVNSVLRLAGDVLLHVERWRLKLIGTT